MRLGVKISQDLCAQIRDKLTMKTSNLIHEKISRKIGSERQRWSYFAFEKKDRITVILLLVRFVCMTQHRADGVYLTMTLKVSGIYGLMLNGMIFVVGIG